MNRRRFLKQAGLWVPAALAFPAIVRAQRSPFADPAKTAAMMRRAAPSGGGYTASATTFNGTNNYLTRGGNLTSVADSKKGIVSAWLNPAAASDGAFVAIVYSNSGTLFRFYKDSADIINLNAGDGADNKLAFQSTSTLVSSGGWKNILMSWDLAANAFACYISDTAETPGGLVKVDANCLYSTCTEWSVGALNAGGVPWAGCMSEVYINFAEYLDMTTTSNRRKFIDASKKPVDLGSDGSTPTGTAPIMYFKMASASWQTNAGSGGGFTAHNAVTSCTAP